MDDELCGLWTFRDSEIAISTRKPFFELARQLASNSPALLRAVGLRSATGWRPRGLATAANETPMAGAG
jgi:hypothetical protein